MSAAKVLGELRLSILRMREWLLLRYATVCFCSLLTVMVSHDERCDGNCRGMLGSCNAGHVKSMHASDERLSAWDVKTKRPDACRQ